MDRSMIGPKKVIKKLELLTVIAQALNDLGYSEIAKSLVRRVHIAPQPALITFMVQQMKNQQWDESMSILPKIQLWDQSVLKEAKIILLKPKIVKLVKEDNLDEAIKLLSDLKVFSNFDFNQIAELSALLICPDSFNDTIDEMIGKLQKLVEPTILMNQHRLLRLVEEALTGRDFRFSYEDMNSYMYQDRRCWLSDGQSIGRKGFVYKMELTTIIAEALHFLDHNDIAQDLESKAQAPTSLSRIAILFQHVQSRNWAASLGCLKRIPLGDNYIMESVCFLILKQMLVDLIDENKQSEIEYLLGKPLTFPTIDSNYQRVSVSLDSSKTEELATIARLPREDVRQYRVDILNNLQELIQLPAPSGRLVYLVEKALETQKGRCPFHNSQDNVVATLYADHVLCAGSTHQVLDDHKDEVCCLEFSHNGKYLASSAKDKSAIVWEVEDSGQISLKQRLEETEEIKEPRERLCWSLDDSRVQSFPQSLPNGMVQTSLEWFPDGNGSVIIWKYNKVFVKRGSPPEAVVCSWDRRPTKNVDIAITKDLKWIITMMKDSKIMLRDWQAGVDSQGVVDRFIKEKGQIVTSFSLSRDSKSLLVDLNHEIHIWDIEEANPRQVATFRSPTRSRLGKSCFGGYQDQLVAAGSENSEIYIWDRYSGNLVATLHGHSAAVNCVSWNPRIPWMLASASSDGMIRIWGADAMKRKRQ